MSKSRIYGAIGSAVFMLLLFLLLWFVYITCTPYQEDEGIEVAILDDMSAPIPFGGEDAGANAYSEQVAQSPELQAPVPAVSESQPMPPAPSQDVMAQEDPSVVAARQQKEKEAREKAEAERKAREKALAEQRAKEEAAAKAKAAQEARERAAKEKAGKLGSLFGNKSSIDGGIGNATGNTVNGNPAGHGSSNGNSWTLNGRSLRGTLSIPQVEFNEDGIVVVEIRVNAAGTVTSARVGQGTNTSNTTLRNAAVQAAYKAVFSTGNNDVLGTITYRFKVK